MKPKRKVLKLNGYELLSGDRKKLKWKSKSKRTLNTPRGAKWLQRVRRLRKRLGKLLADI